MCIERKKDAGAVFDHERFIGSRIQSKILLYILKRLEASYGNEQEEKWIANSAGYYLEALQKELRGAISRLDAYVAEKAENPASSG